VLTADHVIRGAKEIRVAFPRKRPNGTEFETDRGQYFKNDWFVAAEVAQSLPTADLAILRLKVAIPAGMEPIKLGTADPALGDRCHTVANQGNSGLWVYNTGNINQIEYREDRIRAGADVLQINTWVYQSSCPVNPGDSGGPLVNDQCELIGVNSSVEQVLNTANRHVSRKVIAAFLAKQPIPGPP
jgi:S1-C subfamily serine protease